MKMSDEHFKTLKEACDEVIDAAAKKRGCTRKELLDLAVKQADADEKIKNSHVAVRWQIFHAVERELNRKYKKSFSKTLYETLNDTHIDTALKKAIPELSN